MFELFLKKIQDAIDVNEEELNIIRKHIVQKKLRKKQYLLQDGDICRYGIFVEKGALRSYFIDSKGDEFIIQFALEGWFLSDLASFNSGAPSRYNIDAIEDSEVVLITRQAHNELIQELPKYDNFLHQKLQNGYIALQNRLLDIISLSAEEKYANLMKAYPNIALKIPQHMIASYLGVSPETLSRIKKSYLNSK